MPLRVECRHCGAHLEANDAAVGRTLPCPKCGEPLTIAAAESATSQPSAAVPPHPGADSKGWTSQDEQAMAALDAEAAAQPVSEPGSTDRQQPVEWYHGGEETQTRSAFVKWLIVLVLFVVGTGTVIFAVSRRRGAGDERAGFLRGVDNIARFTEETRKMYDEARKLAAEGNTEEAIAAYEKVLKRLEQIPMRAAIAFGFNTIKQELENLKAGKPDYQPIETTPPPEEDPAHDKPQ